MPKSLFSLFALLWLAAAAAAQPAADPRVAEHAPYGLPQVDCETCELVVRDRYVLLYNSAIQTARLVPTAIRWER